MRGKALNLKNQEYAIEITPKLVHLTGHVCTSTWLATQHHKALITVRERERVHIIMELVLG